MFRKHARSRRWKQFSRDLEHEVRDSMNTYLDDMISKGRNGKDFFAAVKRLSKPGSSASWSVSELFPGVSDAEVFDRVVDYFATVGGKEEGQLPNDAGVKLPADLVLSVEEVTKRLSNLKKTDSHVDGNPLPHLVRNNPRLFVIPATILFNMTSAEGTWPSAWKTEHLTIIPKVNSPSSLSETRNISCTSLLSKVLEGVRC